jgi:hypothetical protein
MLSLTDVQSIANSRFGETKGKYSDWIFAVAMMLVMILAIIGSISIIVNANSSSHIFLTIPSSCIVSGENIIIMDDSYFGFTVNGYLLKRELQHNDYSVLIACGTLILTIFFSVLIYSIILGYRKSKFVHGIIQQWIDKEIVF